MRKALLTAFLIVAGIQAGDEFPSTILLNKIRDQAPDRYEYFEKLLKDKPNKDWANMGHTSMKMDLDGKTKDADVVVRRVPIAEAVKANDFRMVKLLAEHGAEIWGCHKRPECDLQLCALTLAKKLGRSRAMREYLHYAWWKKLRFYAVEDGVRTEVFHEYPGYKDEDLD